MSDEKNPPPYEGPPAGAPPPPLDHKSQSEKGDAPPPAGAPAADITLFHSDSLGSPTHNPPSTILFPPDTTLIRTWSGTALDGIEYFSATGETGLLGSRGGSPHDFRVPAGGRLLGLEVRSGGWIDGISYLATTTTPNANNHGNSGNEGTARSAWFGGSGGQVTRFEGNIVGFVGEVRDGAGYLGRLAVITAQNYPDFITFYRQTRASHHHVGASSSSSSSSQQQHHPQQVQNGKPHTQPRFRWDTGRLTGNRGIGVRWNHERNRMEIYQGSNNAHQY